MPYLQLAQVLKGLKGQGCRLEVTSLPEARGEQVGLRIVQRFDERGHVSCVGNGLSKVLVAQHGVPESEKQE